MPLKWLILFVEIALFIKTTCGQSKPNFPFCSSDGSDDDRCTSLLSGIEFCVRRFRHEQDCRPMQLEKPLYGIPMTDNAALFSVRMSAYQYKGPYKSYPNVNTSISNIKFTKLRLKYTILTMDERNKYLCLSFELKNPSNGSLESIFWDCPWYKSNLTGHPMVLEYQATDMKTSEYKKFDLRLPTNSDCGSNARNASDLQLLIYREVHNECVTFHWAPPATKFKVSSYRVILNEQGNNSAQPQLITTNKTTIKFCSELKAQSQYNISVEPWVAIKNASWGCPSFSEPFSTRYLQTSNILSTVYFSIIASAMLIMFCILCYVMRHYLSLRVWKEEKSFVKNLTPASLAFEKSSTISATTGHERKTNDNIQEDETSDPKGIQTDFGDEMDSDQQADIQDRILLLNEVQDEVSSASESEISPAEYNDREEDVNNGSISSTINFSSKSNPEDRNIDSRTDNIEKSRKPWPYT